MNLTVKTPRTPRKTFFKDKKLGVLGILAVQNHIYSVKNFK
jgi:hypothetical protein